MKGSQSIWLTISIILITLLSSLLLYKNRSIFLEGFDVVAETPQTRLDKQYAVFIDFYTRFCALWSDAIVKAVSINQNHATAPLSSPSQVEKNPVAAAPQVTEEQRDNFIRELSAKTGKEYPVCLQFPLKLDDTVLRTVKDIVPSNNHPYINALQWMNDQLGQAAKNLDAALSGIPNIQESFVNSYDKYDIFTVYSEGFSSRPTKEGFRSRPTKEGLEDISSNCAIVSHGAQKEPDTPETRCDIEATILKKLDAFLTDKDVLMALLMDVEENKRKAEKVGADAQSGELIKQVKIEEPKPFLAKATNSPTVNTISGDQKVSNVEAVKSNDPQAYDDMLRHNKQLVNLASLLDSINRNLK